MHKYGDFQFTCSVPVLTKADFKNANLNPKNGISTRNVDLSFISQKSDPTPRPYNPIYLHHKVEGDLIYVVLNVLAKEESVLKQGLFDAGELGQVNGIADGKFLLFALPKNGGGDGKPDCGSTGCGGG